MMRTAFRVGVMALALMAAGAGVAQSPPAADTSAYRQRLPEDEVIYFLLPDRFDNADPANDRGGIAGDRLATGFDPRDKGFYHGGDLKGVIRRLDYIQGLGATALWLAPVFRNKAVQGAPGHESAGYHGYWITDFTHVDPHLGTDADFRALVEAAHARGMKVYMDIVVNHTADVIHYRECPDDGRCPYRSRADYPYTRRGGVAGAAINPGFAGDTGRTEANFAKLTDPRYAYTPYVHPAERDAKTPAWLNDVRLYHNRGNSTFTGESATEGDFSGLDDLMTQNPRVLAGMVEVYGGWIDRFGVDGFRIDTARHVEPTFWQAFVPAMQTRAAARGIPHFHIFGEVHDGDPAVLAEHNRTDGLPAVLDFAFTQAVTDTVAGAAGTDRWERWFAADALYQAGAATARQLPTFTGNHDDGRFAAAVRRGFPKASEAEVLARVELANAMLLTLRGVPTVYAGDEQGFVGRGGDQDARQDQFASHVASYNDQPLLGTATTTATAHFDPEHPLYRQIAALARLRRATPALTRGTSVLRAREDAPGLLAASRFDPATGAEILLAFNTADRAIERLVEVGPGTAATTLAGTGCAAALAAPGSLKVVLPAFGYAVCRIEGGK